VQTRARVERAMIDLGYHPNVAARTLRSTRSETLCFLLLDEGNRFLADPMTDLVIAGIGDVARDRGYGLLIRAALPNEPDPLLIKPLLENSADGAFLFLSGEPELRRWYVTQLAERGFPFILLEPSEDPLMLTVTAADREGGRALTEHLIAAGHERIAFLTTAVPWPMLEQRLLGYRDALSAAGLSPLVFFGGTWTPASGAQQVERVMASGKRPTAMMCGNDLLALGAIRAVREFGLKVPKDIAVTGFDDFDFAEFTDPALTTVRIPGYEIGRVAGQSLVDVLEGSVPSERHVVLPVELKLRESA
jgi:DNA-binding LacI/PurR family transcriptional regulator